MHDHTLPNTRSSQLTPAGRALLGFLFGLAVMLVVIRVARSNSYDFEIMRRGTRDLVAFTNPWAPQVEPFGFYNPPFSVLFLWPILFLTPSGLQVIGGACLFALIFYQKTCVALAWFLTNSFLWIISMGGIDMYVMGAGLLLLFMGDARSPAKPGLILRVLAYGFLMVKPQGGIFILGLYFLLRRDWKGLFISAIVYGLFFIPLYPDWLRYVVLGRLTESGTVVHSVWANFGPLVAVIIAVLVVVARPWKYWQLGGTLAAILSPYGMPGIPVFLTLTAVPSLAAIPVVIIFSGGLAALTWVSEAPPGIDYAEYIRPFLLIYHLSMLGLVLALACLSKQDYKDGAGVIAVGGFLKTGLMRAKNRLAS